MDAHLTSPTLWQQVAWLLILAVPIACLSWTVTREEVFREARQYLADRSRTGRNPVARKLFYIPTCEYCFSHYVTLAFQAMTGYSLLLDGWRGYVIGFFALVAIANVYMSAYGRLRAELKVEQVRMAAVQRRIAESPAAARKEFIEAGARTRTWP
jgi:hypothetical protein